MKRIIIPVLAMLFTGTQIFSQSVGIGTADPDPSALLELKSTTSGFMPPRMTAAQKTAIVLPKAGLLIYQTDGTKGLYVYSGTAWVTTAATPSSDWSLTGNSGNSPATNFIGTKDNQPLRFRVNNISAGSLTTGTKNVAFGLHTLDSNTVGAQNNIIGFSSFGNNKTGSDNNTLGANTLYSNVGGSRNVAIGSAALAYNQIGNNNVAVGDHALDQTRSSNNVALGTSALYDNTWGYSNVAIGVEALHYNTTQPNNVAVGDSALYYNGVFATLATDSKYNTAVGSKALFSSTTGSINSAFGFQSLYSNFAGDKNSAFGVQALKGNDFGAENSAFGTNALSGNTKGNSNTAFGNEALKSNITGNANSGFGYSTNTSLSNLTNATAIGAWAQVGCSNCLVLGSINNVNNGKSNVNVGIGTTVPISRLHIKQSGDLYPINGTGFRMERATTSDHWELGIDNSGDFDFVFNGNSRAYIRGFDGSYAQVSDRRMKKDISAVGLVMPQVMKLLPKTYHYIDNNGSEPFSYGFVAQEVEKLFPDFVMTKGPDNLKAIAYQNFNVIAIKAIQEQQVVIESQARRISELEAKMEMVLKTR